MTSTIKVDNIQDQDGNNIINENANTITIGASGDTVTLASGASQSGFGREGSVDWQTGSIKTSGFTAANGEGYFCDTSSSAFTVTLPSGSAGAIVSFADYTRTFQTNNLTITPQSGEKIGGISGDAVLSTEGQAATFVYVDSTEGWINVSDSTGTTGRAFITATGGTITTCGDFKIHTFTSPGTFCVSAISTNPTENTVGYLVVAGGGGGGANHGGGGGAGGYREGRNVPIDNFTASPLVADAPTNAVTITATAFPITVGAGGTAPGNCGAAKGSNSVFSTITSTGGGSGVGGSQTGQPGGSGGGAGGQAGGAGSGNTPPTTPAQGTNGGAAPNPDAAAGGGGGAVDAGSPGGPRCVPGGPGGDGTASSITGSSVTRGGGGGGGNGGAPGPTVGGTGGPGGGGNGGGIPFDSSAGTANTGGGGGGGANPAIGAGTTARNGGSGIVIIRYKYQ